MTLYPNIIYHPDYGYSGHIFLDTLQNIGNPRNADVVEYTSAVDGKPYSFTRDRGQRGATLNCKIDTDNENTLRRQLDYLIGEQVYLMMGAEELATLAKIRSYDFQKSVKTYTPLVLDVVCDGSSEGQFREAEDSRNTTFGTTATVNDTDASGGQARTLSASTSDVIFGLTQSDIVLPEGNYTMFARVKDTNQVTDDVGLYVYNITDTTLIFYEAHTVAASYGIITGDFSISSSDAGDSMHIWVRKMTSTTNTVYVDYLGFVRTD